MIKPSMQKPEQGLEIGLQAIEEVNKKLSSSLFRRVIGSKVVTTVEPFDGEYWLAEVHNSILYALVPTEC